jgi:hypothetical protein
MQSVRDLNKLDDARARRNGLTRGQSVCSKSSNKDSGTT